MPQIDKTIFNKSYMAFVDPVSTMPKPMQQYAIDCAILSIVKHGGNQYEMAKYIKEELDKEYGPNWCCIIGNEFRAYFTYQLNTYTVFKIQNHKFLMYKEL